jgi:hypothetical protein
LEGEDDSPPHPHPPFFVNFSPQLEKKTILHQRHQAEDMLRNIGKKYFEGVCFMMTEK